MSKKLHKMVNGKKVFLSTKESKALQSVWEKGDEELLTKKRTAYRDKRRKEYPEVGDQLDVILKQLAALPDVKLLPEMAELINLCLEIKKKHPKS